MTKEEVINKLHWALDNNTIENVQSAYEYIEAVEIAIMALEKLDKVEQILQRRNDGCYEQGTYREGNHWQILDEIEGVMYEDRDSN